MTHKRLVVGWHLLNPTTLGSSRRTAWLPTRHQHPATVLNRQRVWIGGSCMLITAKLLVVELGLPLLEEHHHFVEVRRFAEKHLLHLCVIVPQCFEPVLRWRNT